MLCYRARHLHSPSLRRWINGYLRTLCWGNPAMEQHPTPPRATETGASRMRHLARMQTLPHLKKELKMSIPNTSLKRNRAMQTFNNSDIIYTPIQAVFCNKPLHKCSNVNSPHRKYKNVNCHNNISCCSKFISSRVLQNNSSLCTITGQKPSRDTNIISQPHNSWL